MILDLLRFICIVLNFKRVFNLLKLQMHTFYIKHLNIATPILLSPLSF